MHIILLPIVAGLTLLLVIGLIVSVAQPDIPVPVRLGLAAMLLLPSLFCLFGVATTFEPGPHHMTWRLGYSLVGLLFLACAAAVALGQRRSPKE